MRILTILVLLQTGILLVLLGKLVLFEDEPNALEGDDLAISQSKRYSDDTDHYSNEDRLRQIIREELGAELDGRSGPDKRMDAVIPPDSVATAEDRNQWELVAQQLEYHTSVGSISNVDMQELQQEIAKLDKASQEEMLWKLTQALNSGQLEGRL